MASLDVFLFQDYKIYLRKWMETRESGGHGERSRIAKAIGCQVAYVSQVLNGSASFSLEQSADLSGYLGHSKEEAEYFILLTGYARAGTRLLKDHYKEQMNRLLEKRRHLSERLELKTRLSKEDEATYYSAWYFSAIHMALAVEDLRSTEALSRHFGLPQNLVSQVIEYLLTRGLAKRANNRLQLGQTGLHLPSDSPMVTQHHSNWRLRAIDSLSYSAPSDLHYSSVASFGRKDKEKVHDILVQAIQVIRSKIRESPDEALYCYALDLFSLERGKA